MQKKTRQKWGGDILHVLTYVRMSTPQALEWDHLKYGDENSVGRQADKLMPSQTRCVCVCQREKEETLFCVFLSLHSGWAALILTPPFFLFFFSFSLFWRCRLSLLSPLAYFYVLHELSSSLMWLGRRRRRRLASCCCSMDWNAISGLRTRQTGSMEGRRRHNIQILGEGEEENWTRTGCGCTHQLLLLLYLAVVHHHEGTPDGQTNHLELASSITRKCQPTNQSIA